MCSNHCSEIYWMASSGQLLSNLLYTDTLRIKWGEANLISLDKGWDTGVINFF